MSLLLGSLLLPAQAWSAPVDHIIIEKAARKLSLYAGPSLVASYAVALGRVPSGAKTCQGDGRTPEGEYTIDGRVPHSHYHMALHLSYPNAADRRRAHEQGCAPGGDIMIHGLPNGYGWVGAAHRQHDWTAGCIAVTDTEIEAIWAQVATGTRVTIKR